MSSISAGSYRRLLVVLMVISPVLLVVASVGTFLDWLDQAFDEKVAYEQLIQETILQLLLAVIPALVLLALAIVSFRRTGKTSRAIVAIVIGSLCVILGLAATLPLLAGTIGDQAEAAAIQARRFQPPTPAETAHTKAELKTEVTGFLADTASTLGTAMAIPTDRMLYATSCTLSNFNRGVSLTSDGALYRTSDSEEVALHAIAAGWASKGYTVDTDDIAKGSLYAKGDFFDDVNAHWVPSSDGSPSAYNIDINFDTICIVK